MFSLRVLRQPSIRRSDKSGLIPIIQHCLVGIRDLKEAKYLPAVSGKAETQSWVKGARSRHLQ